MTDDPIQLKMLRLRFAADEATGERVLAVLKKLGMLRDVRVLKRDEGSSVLWVDPADGSGGALVLKVRALGVGDRIKRTLRCGRGDRQRRGATALAGARVGCAPVLAIASVMVDGCIGELLAMPALAGRTLLECLRDLDGSPVAEQHALAHEVGRTVGAILDAGLFNRDHKPSNVMVHAGGVGVSLSVLDTVAIRRVRDREDALERMLASLVIEPIGCGVQARHGLMMRALRGAMPAASRAARHAMWRRVVDRVRAHGDPGPKVDPLSGGGAG